MRKLYALFAGLLLFFTSVQIVQAQPNPPDSCTANFERIPLTGTTPLTAGFQAIPWNSGQNRPVEICWRFGDGRDTCIQYTNTSPGPYNVMHTYLQPGTYNVCVRIKYNGGCVAEKCKQVVIGQLPPDSCGVNFEAGPFGINPLGRTFTAIPSHNNNKKPVSICWVFGDGRDTCIQYNNTFSGPYTVNHTYSQPGLYNVCVRIVYQGGCVAEKCKPFQVGPPDSCRADFERLALSPNASLLSVLYKALPSHSSNKKPQRICWTFGDGRDTCINYPASYTGLYTVSHTYNQPGLYEVCVKILYQGGCDARKCKTIQTGRPDSCRADFERTPLISNLPLFIGFKALPEHNNNKKPKQICWVFGDGRDTCISYPENYSGSYTVSHRFPRRDTFRVCVRIQYYGGCVAKKCKPVITGPLQRCSVKILEITPSVSSLVRGFFAYPQSEPQRRVERICWYFGDGRDTCILMDSVINPGDFFIRHTYPAPGAYRACVKVKFAGGCEADDCIPVFIRSNTSICGGFMVDSMAGPRTFKFRGQGIHNPGDQVVSYRWNFGDGSTANGQEVSHTYTTAGDFEVCLVMRTQLGCETKICKKVRVPGNNTPSLVLTPNPVITNLHVVFRSTHTEAVNIRIMRANGMVVRNMMKNVVTGENNWDFNLTDLTPGAYSFTVQSPHQLASAIFFKQ